MTQLQINCGNALALRIAEILQKFLVDINMAQRAILPKHRVESLVNIFHPPQVKNLPFQGIEIVTIGTTPECVLVCMRM